MKKLITAMLATCLVNCLFAGSSAVNSINTSAQVPPYLTTDAESHLIASYDHAGTQAVDIVMNVSTTAYDLLELNEGFPSTIKEVLYTIHGKYTYNPNTYKITTKQNPWLELTASWGDTFRVYTRNSISSSAYLNNNNVVRFNYSFDLLCDINADGTNYGKLFCGGYWINCEADASGVISEGSST